MTTSAELSGTPSRAPSPESRAPSPEPRVPSPEPRDGVTFVVPVHNGARYLSHTLASIAGQEAGHPIEIIVVEDQSTDGSRTLLEELAAIYPLTIVPGPGLGAAAALNTGIRLARYPFIGQVDQDVVLAPDWTRRLVATLDGDRQLAAAQGYYATDPAASFFARIMGLDLEQRYAAISGPIDHVCTGNTVYRADALRGVGLLDETLGYGYDNDLSYRLQAAGHRLALCRTARSRHRWREGLFGYLSQQYGFGYGRVDVVARHPARCAGDAVSPISMMAHPVVTGLALLLFSTAAVVSYLGGSTRGLALLGCALLAGLVLERLVAGVRAWRRFRDPVALAFPLVHLARNAAWLAAVLMWLLRRVLRRPFDPTHSMSPRPVAR